ncbi:MAG: hypothetical protein WAT09_19995 [Paracoccaceae bacterium]
MGAVSIAQMANRVSGLIEQRLGVRGRGLQEQIRKAGRRLPRRVRDAAVYLADAGLMAQNPKLLVRIDEGQVATAYDTCVKHLVRLNKGERRKGLILNAAASAAFAVLAVTVGVLVFVYWRGLV